MIQTHKQINDFDYEFRIVISSDNPKRTFTEDDANSVAGLVGYYAKSELRLIEGVSQTPTFIGNVLIVDIYADTTKTHSDDVGSHMEDFFNNIRNALMSGGQFHKTSNTWLGDILLDDNLTISFVSKDPVNAYKTIIKTNKTEKELVKFLNQWNIEVEFL